MTTESAPEYSIELDCPPGDPRPGDLIGDVLDGTGLNESDFEQRGRVFGNWTWVLKPDDSTISRYEAARETVAERIRRLYATGTIRYGSW